MSSTTVLAFPRDSISFFVHCTGTQGMDKSGGLCPINLYRYVIVNWLLICML
jgi:hypothetical protein